jgi:hypothetical protein
VVSVFGPTDHRVFGSAFDAPLYLPALRIQGNGVTKIKILNIEIPRSRRVPEAMAI